MKFNIYDPREMMREIAFAIRAASFSALNAYPYWNHIRQKSKKRKFKMQRRGR